MMKISAVTIAKNEAANLGHWLESVKTYADEIIVVDTGSTDDTVAIAERAGARVEHFPWTGDFSAAKNYAISLTSGQWIAFLDADEYFPPASASRVRGVIEDVDRNLKIAGIVTKLLNIDRDEHDRLISTVHQIRLFRRHKDIYYKGKVHEALTGIQIKGRKLQLVDDILIYHTGYSTKIIGQKLERNLALLKEDIANRGPDPGDNAYFADCYFGLGEYEKAIDYARKHIASGIRRCGDETAPYARLITSLIFLNRPIEEIMVEIEKAVRAFPLSGLFHFFAGYLHFRDKNYPEAIRWYDDGLKIIKGEYSEVDGFELSSIDRGDSMLPNVYFQRGRIAELMGDKNAAVGFFLDGLKEYPHFPDTLYHLVLLMKEQKAADIIAVLNSFYGDADVDYLVNALENLPYATKNLSDVYVYYVQRAENLRKEKAGQAEEAAGRKEKTPDELFAAGRFAMAAGEAAAHFNSRVRLGILAELASGEKGEASSFSLIAPPPVKSARQKLLGNAAERPDEATLRLAAELGLTEKADREEGENKEAKKEEQLDREAERTLKALKETKKSQRKNSDTKTLIAKAAQLFGEGERNAAIKLLLPAFEAEPSDSDLCLALATFSQLIGGSEAKENTRRILLAATCRPTAEMKELWREVSGPGEKEYPLVSIMIPTYNRPELFERTLKSALAQTYANVEIIVTDNSTDERTAELVADSYRDELRLVYVRNREAKCKEDNFKPMEKLARGEYLQWCMDDDILYPKKLEKMVPHLLADPKIKLVTSHRAFIDVNDELVDNWYDDIPFYDFVGEWKRYTGEEIGRYSLCYTRNFLGEPSCVLFRRCDLKHHYWKAEAKGLYTISDIAMWLELLEDGDCVIFKEALSAYRRHPGQEGQGNDVIILSRFEWENLIEEYYRRHIFLTDSDMYRDALYLLYCDATVTLKDVGPASERYGEAFCRYVRRLLVKLQLIQKNKKNG